MVRRHGEDYEMDLPAIPTLPGEAPPEVVAALGAPPVATAPVRKVHHADYWLAEYRSVAEIDALRPDVRRLGELRSNVVATAPGDEVDFVSRFFAPASGVDEDPVTGSAHCTLAVYWAERWGRTTLTAEQRSARRGRLTCEVAGDRVKLRGPCVRVFDGTLFAPDPA